MDCNMEVKDYIISQIQNITDKIKGVSIKYAFENATCFHIIEVFPESIRRENQEYMDLESELWFNFHRNYPCEDILISGESEDNDMSNIIYQTCEINEAYQYNNSYYGKNDIFEFQPNQASEFNFLIDSSTYDIAA